MLQDLNTTVLNLIEATITLYAADETTGAPAAALWTGAAAENLSIKETWLKVETKPTGAAFPKKHPLVPQFEVSIGRVWLLQQPLAAGVSFARKNYVLDVVWNHEDGIGWHRITFYGVTISTRSRTNQDVAGGFVDEQVFEAQLAVPTGGSTSAEPPALPAELPATVRYVSTTENVLLYTYSAGTFTAAASTTGRATIAPNGGDLEIKFSGYTRPALTAQADGTCKIISLCGGLTARSFPRLDFYLGLTRVASVTVNGELFAANVTEGALDGTGIQLGAAALFTLAGAQIVSIEEFSPNDITTLAAWFGSASLPGVDGSAVTAWPDELGALDLAGTAVLVRDSGNRAVNFAAGQRLQSADSLTFTGTLTAFAVAKRNVGAVTGVLFAGGAYRWFSGTAATGWKLYENTPASVTLAAPVSVGGASGQTSFGGSIAGVLVFAGALTTAERDAVRMWLRANYVL